MSANDANIAVLADHLAGKPSSKGIIATGIETDASKWTNRIAPNLAGIPETMLWALHNRACEARRCDTVLVDPDSIRIHETIDYDFARYFGNPEGSLAMRAAQIDSVLRNWIELHPDGLVVSLGPTFGTTPGNGIGLPIIGG